MKKFFLKSKTILGVLIMVTTNLGPLVGLSFGADDAAMVTADIDAILTALGGLLATYGRVKAKSSLSIL